jgi:hypothetical protein
VGLDALFKALRLFAFKDLGHKAAAHPQGSDRHHQRLIDQKTWDRVHAILQESPRLRANNTRTETPALLKGLLFGEDGVAFSPTHTRKGDRLYRYYVSQSVLKGSAADGPAIARISAAEIKGAVIAQVRGLLRQPEVGLGAWRAA